MTNALAAFMIFLKMERKGKRNLEDIIYTRQTLTSTHDNVDSYMANKINVFC